MGNNNLKTKVMSGLVWEFSEKTLAQLISIAVSIVLARLLMPEAYGVIALVMAFVTIADTFVRGGFGASLIQKKNADALDFSTIFYFGIFMGIVFYIALFFIAPLIAGFYEKPELTAVIRVVSLGLLVTGFNSVLYSYISKKLLFRKRFFSSLGGTLVSAVVGITMAYMGFGVWALVAQYLTDLFLDTVILFLIVDWRPICKFSFTRFKQLSGFGLKKLASGLIQTGYNELRALVIGKVYTVKDLSYYNNGVKFPKVIINNIGLTIDSVLFPTLSNENDNVGTVKAITKRSVRVSAFIMLPMMVGLVMCAKPLVLVLLTEKWINCVPYLQIACISQAPLPIFSPNIQAVNAMGRSDITLKTEIIKKIFGITVVLLSMNISVMAVALSGILYTLFSIVVDVFPNRKLIRYGYTEQLSDIAVPLIMSVLMGVCIWFVKFLNFSVWLDLIVRIVVGISVYLLLSVLFKSDSLQYILEIIRPRVTRLFKRKS